MALSLLEAKMLNEVQKYAFGTGGKVFYVDNSGNPKFDLETAPYATITLALAQCVANRGDVILVRRGHAETLSAAAGIAITKAGVSIIGQGRGASRPTITMGTSALVDIDIDAADVTIDNIVFVANFLNIAAAIDVNAKNFTIRNCHFREGTNLNFLKCIITAATNTTDGLLVEDNKFECPDSDNTECIELVGASDNVIIRRNYFRGDWGISCISAITAASTNLQIYDNFIANLQTTDIADIIDLVASTTGVISNNVCFHLNVTTNNHINCIDGGSCWMGVNRIQDQISSTTGQYGDIAGTINTDA